MEIGTRLRSTLSFDGVRQGVDYYFLCSDAVLGRVLLADFSKHGMWRVEIIEVERERFEQALLNGEVRPTAERPTLPPWLCELEGIDLGGIDACRLQAKGSNHACALKRLSFLRPLLPHADRIWRATDPSAEIASLVRELLPNQHATRLTLWFVAFHCFGRSEWALWPSFHAAGDWDRTRKGLAISGRRPVDRPIGSRCVVDGAMRKKILDGYVKYCGTGVTQRKAYTLILRHQFGCKVDERKWPPRITNSNRQPYPSPTQVRYIVEKEFDHRKRRETVYGAARVRHHSAPSEGRFSEAVANVMEQVEADAQYAGEWLTGFCGEVLTDRFCVVRVVDVATGTIIGIGFTLGHEICEAYAMALFCAAIDKQDFARLFGLDILPESWPCIGLPADFVNDRGPGASERLLERSVVKIHPEMVPSYAPRSKSTVEGGHQKHTKTEGSPEYVVSPMTPVAAAKQEIIRAIKDNHSRNVGNRTSPEMIATENPCNPTEIWHWMVKRGRTSAARMSFVEAVTSFLTPVKMKVTREGVRYLGRRFDSASLRETGVVDRAATGLSFSLDGFVLHMCVRYAWIKVAGRLVEVEAILPLRDDESQLYLTVGDLEALKYRTTKANAANRAGTVDQDLHFEQAVQDATGMAADGGKRRTGTKKRTAASRNASAAARRATNVGASRGK